jgi:hypothetical protein
MYRRDITNSLAVAQERVPFSPAKRVRRASIPECAQPERAVLGVLDQGGLISILQAEDHQGFSHGYPAQKHQYFAAVGRFVVFGRFVACF